MQEQIDILTAENISLKKLNEELKKENETLYSAWIKAQQKNTTADTRLHKKLVAETTKKLNKEIGGNNE